MLINKKVVWYLPALGIKQSTATDDVAYPPEDKSGTGKISGNSPQTTSKSKDTKEEDTSQFAENRNSEFSDGFFKIKTEPKASKLSASQQERSHKKSNHILYRTDNIL